MSAVVTPVIFLVTNVVVVRADVAPVVTVLIKRFVVTEIGIW